MASLFGPVERTEAEHWGAVETLRVFYKKDLEVEFNFSTPDWAAIPVDPGTHRVVSDGMRILFDLQDLLGSAQRAVLEKEHGREAPEIAPKEPTMSQPLREPLEHLHRELGEADAKAHPSLSELHRDTRSTLEHPDPQAAVSADPSFRRRLEEAVRRYEASHPGVTRAAQNVLDVLTANGL